MTHFLHDAVVRNLARQFEKIREGAQRASPPISSAAKTLPKKLTDEAGSRGGVRQAVGHGSCSLKRFGCVRQAAPAR
jgi:hypothetical protein